MEIAGARLHARLDCLCGLVARRRTEIEKSLPAPQTQQRHHRLRTDVLKPEHPRIPCGQPPASGHIRRLGAFRRLTITYPDITLRRLETRARNPHCDIFAVLRDPAIEQP